MQKYKISKKYGIYAKFKPPFNRFLFPMASFFLGLNAKLIRSDKKVKVESVSINGIDKNKINLYIFEKRNKISKLKEQEEIKKLILYFHGGGFAYKGYNSHFRNCKRLAKETNAKIIYVDYRLAPRYKFPAALNDCFSAYKWVLKNKKNLNIDENKIILMGDSAGGCLAADLMFKIIEEKLVKPCMQMLIYPVLDKRMETESMKIYTDTPMWNSKLNKKMWKCYLGDLEYISPNERTNLSDMIETYIEVAEYDCLRDEGIEFANKLKKANVKVSLEEIKGTMHGYDIKTCDITENAILKRIEVIKNI